MTHQSNYPKHFLLHLMVCLLAGISCTALAELLPVTVKTWGEHFGGNIVYHHQVTNNGNRNVVGIAVGLDTDDQGNGQPVTRERGELNFVMPIGMESFNPGSNPPMISGPTGWTGEMIQIEHGGRYLQWRRPRYPQSPLLPGQTLGFSVTVPGKIDDNYLIRHFSVSLSQLSRLPSGDAYLTGHFSADFPIDGGPRHYNGIMEKLDTTPPVFTVTLNPSVLRPSKKLIPIAATVTVKDNYDPAPEIKLESITPSELTEPADIRDASLGTDDRQFMLKAEREGKNKAGRIYTVIYSATDASGNQSTASATVTVPHDEREHEDRRDEKSRKHDKD
jgi:hypothetical protein